MKRILTLGIVLLTVNSLLPAQEITFSETKFNWGTVREQDGNVSHDFRFVNTGDKPLTIKNIITGCGCTSSEWTEKAYQPGEEGIIRLVYHPQGRTENDINLVTEIYTNRAAKGVVTLEMAGKITRETPSYSARYNPANGKRSQSPTYIPQDEYEQILERIREELYAKTTTQQADRATEKLLRSMLPEGKWSDLDYACFFRTNWEPVEHLKRLVTIAASYTDKQSRYYGNEVLYNAIRDALQYWVKQDPTCFNWWYNQISVPQTQASLLALMDAGQRKLPSEIRMPILKAMGERSDPRKWTGANKMDIAIHHLVRGCLLKNDSIVRVNADEIFYPVQIVANEGIQEDLSYHQHGPQLYIGGYGTVFVDNIVRMGNILNGTKYAMNPEKLTLFSNFIRNTYFNVFRSRYLDFSVTGRGVSRKGTLDYGDCAALFRNLQALDAKHAGEYADIARRFLTQEASYQRSDKNTMYHCSDYMLHNRQNYDFSVRTSSTRTNKTESGNGENLYGTYMSDGATNIRVNGNEYADIFPVWEWDRIPGTTLPAGEKRNPVDWGSKGTCTFTGGVSDGKYGVMTFKMDDYGVKAQKSWFMFDNEVVCLGSGIGSNVPTDIVTTVNQCHLDGNVWINTGKTLRQATQGEFAFEQAPQWIWHDSIAYLFPQGNNIKLKMDRQKGNWAKINFNYPATEISMPIFNLVINHGQSPRNASYAYIVVPGINHPEKMKTYSCRHLKIERNDTEIQAVNNRKSGILQIVFFKPGTFDNEEIKVKALKPCVVQIKRSKGKVTDMQIADPQNQEKLKPGVDVIIL